MSVNLKSSELPLAEVDLTQPHWFVDGPPYDLFARIRAEQPVVWNAMSAGPGFWSVTKAAHIAEISRNTDAYSSFAGGLWFTADTFAPLEVMRNLVIFKDPPDHTAYRSVLQSAFLPRAVNDLEQAITEHVDALIDDICERGECDFVTDFAVPLPLTVIGDMLGTPPADLPVLFELTARMEQAARSGGPFAGAQIVEDLGKYFDSLIGAGGAEGKDTLLARLRSAELDGRPLNDVEIAMFFAILIFAGNDTTRNTLSSGMEALLQHPDQVRALRNDPTLVPNAVEEFLRWATALNYFARTATRDVVIGGQPISEGDRLVLWYVSGNRDEEVFADPHRFDVSRDNTAHQAFGGGGRHFCLGAPLARMELRIALERLLARLDDLTLDGPVTRIASSWVNSPTSMRIKFRPVPRR